MPNVEEISYEEMQKLLAGSGAKPTAAPQKPSEYKVVSPAEVAQLMGGKKATKPTPPLKARQPDRQSVPSVLPQALDTLAPGQASDLLETPPSKDEAVAMVRYGVPVATAMATGGLSFMPSLLANAGVVGTSEFTARQIERGFNSPEGQHVLEDLKAGGAMSAIDAGLTAITHGAGKLVTGAIRKFANSRIGKEILEARKLFKTNVERTAAKGVNKAAEKMFDDPFDLTVAEMSREDGGLVAAMDSWASSGTGAGVMKRYRKNRLKYYGQVVDDYYSDLLDKRDKHGIAAFVNQALGSVREPGYLLRPVDAYKKHLYNLFDEELMANHASATLDLTSVKKYLLSSKNSAALKGYRAVAKKYVELLPPLPGKEAAEWSKVPAKNAEKAYREIEGLISDAKAQNIGAMTQAGDLVRRIKEPFTDFVQKNPGLKSLWDEAKNFKGAQAEALENKLIYKIRDTLKDQPAAVAEIFKVTPENAAVAHDNLIRMKEAFSFAAGKSSKVDKTIPTNFISSKTGVEHKFLTKEAADKYYNENILQPLRFSFLKKATKDGMLSGGKLLKLIEDVEKSSNRYLPELFGGEVQVRNMRALGRVLQEAEVQPASSIFLQMKTAQAAGYVGVGAFMFSDDPTVRAIGAGGAAAVLVGPYALAKVLTRPGLTRKLVDGMRTRSTFSNTVSPKLLLALRDITEMKTAENFFKNKPSSSAISFYTTEAQEEANQ